MPQNNPSTITAQLPREEGEQSLVDRTAAGIQLQHLQLEQKATGAFLGIGRRTVPDPAAQFSMSGGQFGNGHAKSTYDENAEE